MTARVALPGPRNALADVTGLRVGHAARTGDGWLSGTTVVTAEPDGAVGGVDVRGGGPGTRETDLLDPRNAVERVHAVVLTGGSAYGLAAADGVVSRLADAGSGLLVDPPRGILVPDSHPSPVRAAWPTRRPVTSARAFRGPGSATRGVMRAAPRRGGPPGRSAQERHRPRAEPP
jgi:hypothetical protein